MEEVRRLLGEELFASVSKKLDGVRLIADDGRMIPKHRFDCINISLKEHKERLVALQSENAELAEKAARIAEAESDLADLRDELAVVTAVAESGAKNWKSVRALLTTAGLHGAGLQESVLKQIKRLQKTDAYLFYGELGPFWLMPCRKTGKTERDI